MPGPRTGRRQIGASAVGWSIRWPALLLAGLLWLGLGAPASAQQADPRLEVWLHHGIAGVHTASTDRPAVRLLAPDGSLRAEGRVGERGGDGRWPVDFDAGGGIDFERPRTLIRPGDRIEVSLDGQTIEHPVPELQAGIDTASASVRGRAPAGTIVVAALLHRDPSWFDAPHDYPVQSQLALQPDFRIDLQALAEPGPGYWAEVAAVDAAGHLTILQVAPPSVTLADSQAYAILRADAGLTPVLTTRNRIDTELFRSAPAYALGGALYAVLMVHGGNPDFGLHQPEEGERVVVLLEDGPEAEPALDEPLPRALASIDRQDRSVWGLAPPEARVRAELDPGSGEIWGRHRHSDAEGAFRIGFGDAGDIGADATANVLVYPGGALARVVGAIAPSLQVELHGNRLGGSIPGWGEVGVELRDAQGALRVEAVTEANALGEIELELRDRSGRAINLDRDDQLRIQPELGRRLDLAVPYLTAQVDESGTVLRGNGPPGRGLSGLAYQRGASIFDFDPFSAETIGFWGSTDNSQHGHYSILCPESECRLTYGSLDAVYPAVSYRLLWVDQPIVGIGVSETVANGRATAGEGLTITALDDQGRAAGSLQAKSIPLGPNSLPGWDLRLDELYPEGLATGDRIELRVGRTEHTFELPDFTWQADVATDTAAGTGPAGRLVAVLALARGEPDQRPAAAVATAPIGPDGQWRASFADFDLRSGDDLEVYLFEASDRFLWWSQDAIPGIDPPTRTPEPTPAPTARPTPPGADPQPVYLPSLRR